MFEGVREPLLFLHALGSPPGIKIIMNQKQNVMKKRNCTVLNKVTVHLNLDHRRKFVLNVETLASSLILKKDILCFNFHILCYQHIETNSYCFGERHYYSTKTIETYLRDLIFHSQRTSAKLAVHKANTFREIFLILRNVLIII